MTIMRFRTLLALSAVLAMTSPATAQTAILIANASVPVKLGFIDTEAVPAIGVGCALLDAGKPLASGYSEISVTPTAATTTTRSTYSFAGSVTVKLYADPALRQLALGERTANGDPEALNQSESAIAFAYLARHKTTTYSCILAPSEQYFRSAITGNGREAPNRIWFESTVNNARPITKTLTATGQATFAPPPPKR